MRSRARRQGVFTDQAAHAQYLRAEHITAQTSDVGIALVTCKDVDHAFVPPPSARLLHLFDESFKSVKNNAQSSL
jgi:hypothetical protein